MVTPRNPSNDASMISRIGEIVARIRKNPALAGKINGSTDLINEIGLDSLEMIDFLLAFEEEFQTQVDFNSLAMEHLTSVDALCNFVQGARGEAGGTAAAAAAGAASSLPAAVPTSETDDDRSR